MNFKQMYTLYIETGKMDHLPTYQLSQDSLECLFSRIRSLNGNCENPPVTMFQSALRKVLIHNEITSSHHSNCVDDANILSISSRQQHSNKSLIFRVEVDQVQSEEDEEYFNSITLNESEFLMTLTEEATIARIASTFEEKISKSGRFKCECISVLHMNEKVVGLTVLDKLNPPCISTLNACKTASILFELCRTKITFNYSLLIEKIMKTIDFDFIFEQYFPCALSHKQGFIKYIVEEFIRLKANYIAKNLTLIEQKILCRKVLQKKIHFGGQ